MAFDAGAIKAKLGLDTGGFTGGMLQAEAISRLFPGVVSAFLANPLLGFAEVAKEAAASVAHAIGSIKEAFLETAHAADEAGRLADKIGVSTEFLTGVGAAASDAGSSMEEFGLAMKFVNNNAADAAAGNKEIAKAWHDIGVTVTDASGKLKDGEQLFFEIADAIAAIDDPAKKTQAAMNLMGRGGTEMIPMLNKGSAEIKAFAAEIKSLGGTVGTDLAHAGEQFKTLEVYASAAWTGIKRAVAEPILQFVAAHFEEIKAAVFDVADTIRNTLGEAMRGLDFGGVLREGIALFKELARTLASIDWRATAQKVLEVAEAVGKLAVGLVKVAEVIGPLFNGPLPRAVGGFGNAFSLAAGPVAGAAFGGGGGGGGGVVIQNVNVDASHDPQKLAKEIEAQIRAPIRRKAEEAQSADRREFISRSL